MHDCNLQLVLVRKYLRGDRLSKLLTSYRQCAGGGDRSNGVGSHAFVNTVIFPVGLGDLEDLPAIWVGHEAHSVIHLQWLPIWENIAMNE